MLSCLPTCRVMRNVARLRIEIQSRRIFYVINTAMKKKMRSFILLAALAAGSALADGNIYAVSKFAWSENNGWQNWRPAYTNVTVVKNGAAGYLSGSAWAENIGWVHFKNTSLTNSYNIHTTVFSLIMKINGVFLEQIKSINGAEPWSGVNGLR